MLLCGDEPQTAHVANQIDGELRRIVTMHSTFFCGSLVQCNVYDSSTPGSTSLQLTLYCVHLREHPLICVVRIARYFRSHFWRIVNIYILKGSDLSEAKNQSSKHHKQMKQALSSAAHWSHSLLLISVSGHQ